MKLQVVLGLIVAICLVSAPIDARHHKEKMSHSIEKMTKRLDLSSSQVSQIKSINNRYESVHDSVMSSIKPLKEQVKELKQADTPDYTRIRSILQQMAPYRIDMHINRIKHRHEIMSVLTPEQKKKFKKAREKRREKRRNR